MEDLETASSFIILVTAAITLPPQTLWQNTSIYFSSSWVCGLAGVWLVLTEPGWIPGSGLGSSLSTELHSFFL